MKLGQVELMSDRFYSGPDDDSCVGECVERAMDLDPSVDEESVECDCDDVAEERRRDYLESLAEADL